MAKTTLDDLLTVDMNGEEETLPAVEKKKKLISKSAGPGSPMSPTLILPPDISKLCKDVASLNLWQRNPDFIHGDGFQLYHCHPSYKNTPYITSYPPIRNKIKEILWTADMRNQPKSEETPKIRSNNLENYISGNRIEVIKMYKDITVTVPNFKKSAIFLLEGAVWVLTSKKAAPQSMLALSDIRHGEEGLWLKAVRQQNIFPRKLEGEDRGVLVGNLLLRTIVAKEDSLLLVIDYD